MIEVSPHDPAAAYLAATRYKLDDTRPMLYRTTDYGQTWTSITAGLPQDDYTRVVREDPNRSGLLYAGTETGVYVSFNQGESWQPLRANLPVVPVYDLAIKDNNLIAAVPRFSNFVVDPLSVGSLRDDQGCLVEGVGRGGLGGELDHLDEAGPVDLPASGLGALQEIGGLSAVAAGAVQGFDESGEEHLSSYGIVGREMGLVLSEVACLRLGWGLHVYPVDRNKLHYSPWCFRSRKFALSLNFLPRGMVR